MLRRITTITLLLTVYIQYINGVERVIVVSESDIHDVLISNDDVPAINATGSGSGSHVFEGFLTLCCVYGNCSCPSLYNALASLTSNVLINITTDVVLSSIIPLDDLANITITGHNNPTVSCNGSGGLHFVSCHNCIIEGITWDKCGDKNITENGNVSHPIIQLINASNITIKDCSFQHSIGQAILLSQIIGAVNISHCNFLSNNHYEGHGSAIHYSSHGRSMSSLTFMIGNSNFTHNEGAKSVVYFNQLSKSDKSCEYLYLQNSNFYYNKEVPIYLSNQNLYISGNIEFNGNVAENGGGIYISDHSNVTVHKSATVKFTHNRANRNGGAIFLCNHSSITLKEHNILQPCYYDKLYYTVGDQYFTRSLIAVAFYNNTANEFGGDIYVHHSKIMFGNFAEVSFDQNCCIRGELSYKTIERSIFHISKQSQITFDGNSKVTFSGYTITDDKQVMMYVCIDDYSTITFEGNSAIDFTDNVVYGNGVMMYIYNHSTIIFEGNSTVNFISNEIYDNGRVLQIKYNSTIRFEGSSNINFIYNGANDNGALMCIADSSIIISDGNSSVSFIDNHANDYGRLMYIVDSFAITFKRNSTVNFTYNEANDNGGIMYIDNLSTISFEGNSAVNFIENNVMNGELMSIQLSYTITFEGNSTINFKYNNAFGNGLMMFINDYSNITSKESSTVNFIDNKAYYDNGGVMYIYEYSAITFEGNSTVNFLNNTADNNGEVMIIWNYSNVTFEGNCIVNFIDNEVYGNGGVMYIDYSSAIIFKENSLVYFIDNYANGNGGVMYIYDDRTMPNYSIDNIIFQGNSAVNFINNHVNRDGGVMYIKDDGSKLNSNIDVIYTIIFQGNSTVRFINNHANGNGGVMYIDGTCTITFGGNSTVKCINNTADNNGGVMYTWNITFEGNSAVTFIGNHANGNGGVMYINDDRTSLPNDHTDDVCAILFQANSSVNFTDNHANGNGGVIYINHVLKPVTATFVGNSTVNFLNNTADINGGVMYTWDYSNVTFEENSTVTFVGNHANGNGGVMYFEDYSNITFQGNSTATFHHNHANSSGGVMYIDQNSNLWLKEKTKVVFNGNTAYLGGSVYMKFSSFIIDRNSSVIFTNNSAFQDGGAIYLRDRSDFKQLEFSNITFNYNSASDYGGAIYVLYNNWTSINFYNHAYFKGNTAGMTQSSVYINVDKSCDRNCFFADKSNIPMTTSPNRLVLYNPAKCINDNETDCDTYYMNDIMLGQDITFDACLLDYFDQPTEAAEFLITGKNHQEYSISNSKFITISCNRTTKGITVTGNLESNKTYNYSVNISLYVTRFSESKVISINLIVELSQCHPGFYYSPANESRKCECYNNGNIISCSGSNSTIKRGYWYGSVSGTPTVATCPNDYCNFTCCEISNGIYHLSPVRANQCRPHRSGTACGSCEEGYTLSFDSPKCVEENRCTFGLILVITLSLLYWIAVVIAVFVMMYFKASFGSLYAIVYYYSVIDILLSRVLFISNGLYTTVTIMSSLAKMTPQFLGQLCLARNMSGIDQQFIHYVHPVIVLLILVKISGLARRSRKVSSFVSKGIISFVCFLMLLSYTSIASTSLLLMRPLIFVGIDKVYTYLSPNIEYFHGRHIAYAIVALILTITIVIGFPLLLLLEPFLNSKINFIKIKPLLDQFQGCYKDKYRYFAGYYMICRLVIILLVIVKISDDFTNQYLLISSCALMQLIHVLVRPYASTIQNIFDGIILQLIVIISVLPVIEFADQYDEDFVIVMIYVLVFLPLISFIAIKVWINKNIVQIVSYKCKNIYTSCYYNEVATDDPQEPVEIREFDVIVDENMRRNAIIVDV